MVRLRFWLNESSCIVGCNGYPNCREVLWIPTAVNQISVMDESCAECSDSVQKVRVIFDPSKVPSNIPTEKTSCLQCDAALSQLLISLGSRFPVDAETADPNAPMCHCNVHSVQRTTTKANENQGRKFYTCASKSCEFFEWATTEPTAGSSSVQSRPLQRTFSTGSTGNPFSGPSSSNFQPPSFQNRQSSGQKPKCRCDLLCTLRTVNQGENAGRNYYTCTKAGKKCSFFSWADEQGNPLQNDRPSVSSTTGSQTCYRCGQEGHYANACTNQANSSSNTAAPHAASSKKPKAPTRRRNKKSDSQDE